MNITSDEIAVVLAAHGAPATDYPPRRVGLLMMLEFGGSLVDRLAVLRRWRERLAEDVARWPRTATNDPYMASVDSLSRQLGLRLGHPVFAGYNEFCLPTIGEAIDRAIAGGARTVVVVPTMLLRGNQHTEVEIRGAVDLARGRHPPADIRYAWPIEQGLLVALLADVVRRACDPAGVGRP